MRLGAAVLVIALLAALPAAAARPASVAAHVHLCCFEMTTSGSASIVSTWPCPSTTCQQLSSQDIHAQWFGEELVSYAIIGTHQKPLLGDLGPGARVKANLVETAHASEAYGGQKCEHYYTTEPKKFDSNAGDGWLAARPFATFLPPYASNLDIDPGAAVNATWAKCGPPEHGTGPRLAQWDGEHPPWHWVVKPPSTNDFIRASQSAPGRGRTLKVVVYGYHGTYKVFHKSHKSYLTSFFYVAFVYFPESELAAQKHAFVQEHPSTSRGMRDLAGKP